MFNPGKAVIPINYLRSICITIDTFIYMLLTLVFRVFFNISNANFLDNAVINNFYNNIQLLIGIFITFNLCFSLITYLVNPDKFSDNNVGASKLVVRIIVALLMFTLLLPLSGIPDSAAPEKSYNLAIKQRGILFGTLQIVQDRVLDQNIIGALILGNNSDRVDKSYKAQADEIVATVLKSFIEKYDSTSCSNDTFENYEITEDYMTILDYANSEKCSDTKTYAYTYIFLGSWICGGILIFIVAGFCLDVAIRLIKLVILRMIAPIPIISYINPNSKNNSFNSWVKMLTSTYLDLFLRIGVIYLVVYICSTIVKNDVLIFQSDDHMINSISRILIFIGLFLFAKQAPKFLMDMLGIKSDGKGFFKNVGLMAGMGALAGGLFGSAATGWRASDEENRLAGRTNKLTNFGRNLLSAATSTIGGAWAGGRAALTAQDHYASAVFRAQQQRNALRAAHSTLPGRIQDNLYAAFTGRGLAAKDEAQLDLANTAFSSIKDWQGAVKQAAIENGAWGEAIANDGNKYRFNYKEFLDALERPMADGKIKVNGVTYDADLFYGSFSEDLLKSQATNYVNGVYVSGKDSFEKLTSRGQKLYSQYSKVKHDTQVAGIKGFNANNYATYGKAMGEAGAMISDMSNDLRHIARRANSQANGNNR